MIKIAIRLDDITEDMDWVKFNRFKGILDQYGIKPLIGVVPANEDDMLHISSNEAPSDFWKYIIELKNDGWQVAMHGVNHIYTTKKGGYFPLNNFSEFAGLPYEEQLELLGYGVDIFNQYGINTDIFMAPGHSFDKNTMKALKNLGFMRITDGFGDQPYKYNDILFYPISFKKSSTLKKANGYSTLVFHVNTMTEKEFEEFEALLRGSSNILEDTSNSVGNPEGMLNGSVEHMDETKNNSNYSVISYSELLNIEPKNHSIIDRFAEICLAKVKYLMVKYIASKL